MVPGRTARRLLWPFFLLLGWEDARIHPGDTVLTPIEFCRYPPDERSLALLALTGWLVPPWGFWVDRTREQADPA